MYWHIARGTDAFDQREGRIDRPKSLSNRQKLYAIYTAKNWEKIYKGSVYDGMTEGVKQAKNAGLFPMWYVPSRCTDL